jgi:GrpB-like predicted nucleotidyltransferase (UPF0157 family)
LKPQRRPSESIERLPDCPIELKPFDPLNKQEADAYCEQLNQILAPFGAVAELFGSVDLEIATKGEWEYAIYLTDEQWFPVLIYMINHFGRIHFLNDDFAVFATVSEDHDIEIIPMRGESAQRNRALMDLWRSDPAALREYEQGKLDHAYSKREYYRWKDEYIAGIVERL